MNTRSGLSLFELLIALALLALIAVGLSGALGFAIAVYDRARLDPEQSERVALTARLRSWLTNAAPPAGIAPYPIDFIGDEKRLEFTTIHSKGFAPEAAALRILVENDAGNLVGTISEMNDDGEVSVVHTVIIAHDINPTFSYFEVDPDDPSWSGTWSDVARLPDLVRIEGAKGDAAAWHTFIVKPLLY
ncbi:prepilin-type N-terminal cleavage/methylation domain-containing protein [Ruegeria sp.]|uniref:prepilin-type N-terminal cleavage/methylation domain-containing protein n=1 Tax=Ruegeria sp. TaxID=1879320 RepID=UPI002318DF41|nr:prepilin-type N-terminal cleavage/methylation domain-containing protein [Ruegeria sp.]MDA7966152.1 prepilin-type N-terminal cleavage/methylation domain-containing protein [Ruegeria sp.]